MVCSVEHTPSVWFFQELLHQSMCASKPRRGECQSGMVSWRAGPVSRFLSRVTCICMTRNMCVQSHVRQNVFSDGSQELW